MKVHLLSYLLVNFGCLLAKHIGATFSLATHMEQGLTVKSVCETKIFTDKNSI